MSRLSHSEVHMVHGIGWLRAAVLGANNGLVATASSVVDLVVLFFACHGYAIDRSLRQHRLDMD